MAQNRRAGRKPAVPTPILVLLGVLLLAIGWRLVSPGTAEAQHPTPRPGVTAAKVLPASDFAGDPRIAETYEMAREIPEVLDGLFCYCYCEHNFGHYSLLTCFESEHAAGCDICLDEARLAYKLHKEGKTLEQIRVAIDQSFGPA